MKIFSGTSNFELAKKIAENLSDFFIDSDQLENLKIDKFADGEILPRFSKSIRNEDVVFIQSTISSDSIMETLLVVDAAKRAGCNSFTLVAPIQGYSRQDKTDHLRSSIGSKMLSDILEKVGVTRLITIDLHQNTIQGFYNIPVIHLNGNKIFLDYIKSLELEDLVICSPDQGAIKKNTDFAKAFPDATFAVINKKRIKPNEIHSMELIGDVSGKNVLILDDLADTLGTLKKASELLHLNGAKSIRAIATHPVLSGSAYKNLEESKLTELIVSDTIPSNYSEKLKVISCADLISNTILRLETKKSIHEINEI